MTIYIARTLPYRMRKNQSIHLGRQVLINFLLRLSLLRGHNCPAGSQQRQSSLPRHQPVHHGRPGYLHGISYGHPQQHHALRELRPKDGLCMSNLPNPPPLQINHSQIQNTKTSAPVSDHHFIVSLSLALSIYRYTCIRIYIF